MKTKYCKYRLSSEQVRCLFAFLSSINLNRLEHGEICVVDEISPEDGKIISDLFYDDNFAKGIEND